MKPKRNKKPNTLAAPRLQGESMFVSTTALGRLAFQDKGHTFTHLEVLADGSCLAAERRGGRDLEAAGLVVRYANPFTSETPPQVLLESKEPLHSIRAAAGGELLAVATKTVHFEKAGTWISKKPKLTGFIHLVDVAKSAEQVFVREHSRCLVGDGARWTELPFARLESRLGVDAQGEVHVVGAREGDPSETSLYALREDGARLVRAEVQAFAFAPDGELVFTTAGSGTRLLATRADEVVELLAGQPENNLVDRIVHALGRLYLVTAGRVYEVENGTATPVMQATGWIAGAAAGNAEVLWIANGLELLCTDGRQWRSTMRVHHDAAVAPKPKPAVKKSAAKKPAAKDAPSTTPRTIECTRVVAASAWPTDAAFDLIVQGDWFVLRGGRLFRGSPGHPFALVEAAGTDLTALDASHGFLTVVGPGELRQSQDGGQTFEARQLGRDTKVSALAREATGTWLGLENGDVLFVREGATKLDEFVGPTSSPVRALVATPEGALVLRESGRLDRAEVAGKKTKLRGLMNGSSALEDGCVSAAGTVVLASAQGVLRGEGKSFGATLLRRDGALVHFDTPVRAVAALEDGRVVAGGDSDRLYVSFDDARTFETLEHSFMDAASAFTRLIAHEGAIYATGPGQPLLRLA